MAATKEQIKTIEEMYGRQNVEQYLSDKSYATRLEQLTKRQAERIIKSGDKLGLSDAGGGTGADRKSEEKIKKSDRAVKEESSGVSEGLNKTADGEMSEKEDSRNRRFSISETGEEMTQEDMDDGTDIDIPSDVIPADVLFYPKKEEISEEQRRAFAKANDERIARDYGTESLEQQMQSSRKTVRICIAENCELQKKQ